MQRLPLVLKSINDIYLPKLFGQLNRTVGSD